MSIKIILTQKQEEALSALERGLSVRPVTRRSLVRLGLLTPQGDFTYRVEAHRNGEIIYKPENGRAVRA